MSNPKLKVTKGKPKPLKLKTIPREDEILIHQLRTGKSPLAAKCLARYKKLEEEEYSKCLKDCGASESVEHLLTCPAYEMIRRDIFLDKDIIEVLNDDPTKVLCYLDRIGRRTAPDLSDRGARRLN